MSDIDDEDVVDALDAMSDDALVDAIVNAVNEADDAEDEEPGDEQQDEDMVEDENDKADENEEEEEDEEQKDEEPIVEPVAAIVVKAPRVKPVVVKKPAYVSIDSDSESDYSDEGGDDSGDDDDDDGDGNREHGVDGTEIHHELQTNVGAEIDLLPRLNGALGTRTTVSVTSSLADVPKFTGESLLKSGYSGSNMPRHYAAMSIVRRLRIDVKDNEIHSLKKNPDLKLASISRGALDAYRQMYFAAYRCMIRTGLVLERGRQGKETHSLPDEAMHGSVRMYYPIGGAI